MHSISKQDSRDLEQLQTLAKPAKWERHALNPLNQSQTKFHSLSDIEKFKRFEINGREE